MAVVTMSMDSLNDNETPKPQQLSTDEKIKIECLKALPSIVLVSHTPKDLQAIKRCMELIHKDTMTVAEKSMKIAENLACSIYRCTGFVVAETLADILILTCLHPLEHCYTKKYPLSTEVHEELFKTTIICDHLEVKYRESIGQVRQREHSRATVVEMNCKKDLCLLRVSKLGMNCNLKHPPMSFARGTPNPLDRVAMVSWPQERHRTICKGDISHQLREAYEFTDVDMGYDFTGIEVNITGEFGCSGSPCINIDGDVIGALHGGRIDCFTDYISWTDITTELTKWGIPISYRSQIPSDIASKENSPSQVSNKRKKSP